MSEFSPERLIQVRPGAQCTKHYPTPYTYQLPVISDWNQVRPQKSVRGPKKARSPWHFYSSWAPNLYFHHCNNDRAILCVGRIWQHWNNYNLVTDRSVSSEVSELSKYTCIWQLILSNDATKFRQMVFAGQTRLLLITVSCRSRQTDPLMRVMRLACRRRSRLCKLTGQIANW